LTLKEREQLLDEAEALAPQNFGEAAFVHERGGIDRAEPACLPLLALRPIVKLLLDDSCC
jgi:hypothetical protein